MTKTLSTHALKVLAPLLELRSTLKEHLRFRPPYWFQEASVKTTHYFI